MALVWEARKIITLSHSSPKNDKMHVPAVSESSPNEDMRAIFVGPVVAQQQGSTTHRAIYSQAKITNQIFFYYFVSQLRAVDSAEPTQYRTRTGHSRNQEHTASRGLGHGNHIPYMYPI